MRLIVLFFAAKPIAYSFSLTLFTVAVMECQNSPPQQNVLIATGPITQSVIVTTGIRGNTQVSVYTNASVSVYTNIQIVYGVDNQVFVPATTQKVTPTVVQGPIKQSALQQQWEDFKKDPVAYASKVLKFWDLLN